MMLRKYKVKVSQREIAAATQAGPTLHEHGCRIDQLSLAVATVTPSYRLLARYDASIDEVRHMINDFGLPVGVEWRGQFLHDDGSRYEDGHYSLVTHVDTTHGLLKIIDPDETSALRGGEISMAEFEPRWWDENWLGSPIDPASPLVRNYHLMFVVVPAAQEAAIRALGLRPPTMALMKAHHRPAFEPIMPEGESE